MLADEFISISIYLCRYGDDAARITDNSLGTVTNIGFTAYNFSNIGVKAVAKRTAKDTGKALVSECESRPLNTNTDSTQATQNPSNNTRSSEINESQAANVNTWNLDEKELA